MDIVLFIYVLVAITVTIHTLLTRENGVDAAAPAPVAIPATATADADLLPIDGADAARLIKWAEDGHMSSAAPAPVAIPATATADADLLPGEEEDHWEDLAENWGFPEIGKKQSPVIMTGDCRYNRALRGCGRRGKGKQKGGKHIDKKNLRRADTKAHLSLLEELD